MLLMLSAHLLSKLASLDRLTSTAKCFPSRQSGTLPVGVAPQDLWRSPVLQGTPHIASNVALSQSGSWSITDGSSTPPLWPRSSYWTAPPPILIGACFLPAGLGNIIAPPSTDPTILVGAPLAGRILNKIVVKWRQRRGGDGTPRIDFELLSSGHVIVRGDTNNSTDDGFTDPTPILVPTAGEEKDQWISMGKVREQASDSVRPCSESAKSRIIGTRTWGHNMSRNHTKARRHGPAFGKPLG
ncbi:hypothetical protein BD779DRAFT_1478439 [Infundibulicybe gibba]|nr:hypothetical protein BD779DRAFT_1478439 [Infundibulicybe gibba]